MITTITSYHPDKSVATATFKAETEEDADLLEAMYANFYEDGQSLDTDDISSTFSGEGINSELKITIGG
jgi:hypothetical protein